MVLVNDKTSLVVVGVWNPAILTPDWVARNVLGFAKGQEVPVELDMPLRPGQAPVYSLAGITYTPSRDRLVFRLKDTAAESLRRAQEAVARTLALLPHTPVRAFGQNFGFLDETPLPEHTQVFSAANDLPGRLDLVVEVVGSLIRHTVDLEGRTLHLTRNHEGGQLTVEFNFHYEVGSAEEAVAKLEDAGLFQSNFDLAKRILRALYNFEADEGAAAVTQHT